jgi:hypothetical protein
MLWSGVKNRVGRVTVNTHIFFFGLTSFTSPSCDVLYWNKQFPDITNEERHNFWYEKCQTPVDSMKVCNCGSGESNDRKTSNTLAPNETADISATSTCLSIVCPNSKTDLMQSKPLLYRISREIYSYASCRWYWNFDQYTWSWQWK